MNILYVEDDALSREVMEIIVTHDLGMTLFALEDSYDFEQKLLNMPPLDLIFLDIHVKPIDGFEMLAIIRQHAHLKAVPVIALTASVMNEEVKRLRDSGFNGAIAKPIDQDLFPKLIRQILDGEIIWQIIST